MDDFMTWGVFSILIFTRLRTMRFKKFMNVERRSLSSGRDKQGKAFCSIPALTVILGVSLFASPAFSADYTINELLTPETIGKEEFLVYQLAEKIQHDGFQQYQIGNKIVFFHQRTIGEVIVEHDFLNYQFDQATGRLLKRNLHWRDDLAEHPPKTVITKTEAETRAKRQVNGNVLFSNVYFLSPDSAVFPLPTVPQNPCWVVRLDVMGSQAIVMIDAVTGQFLGYGISPPAQGFSLTGPTDFNPCRGSWASWVQNADLWFRTMGFPSTTLSWPTKTEIQNYLQDPATKVFYEIGHSGYVPTRFCSGCLGGEDREYTTASDIEAWLASRDKMPFTFIASCFSMCDLSDDTLSYEFRKNSVEDTVTIGYCGMSEAHCDRCWIASRYWQDRLFTYLAEGKTAKEAFDLAQADYPVCASDPACIRFAGDETVIVPADIQITQGTLDIPSNAGSYDFGEVGVGVAVTAPFTIANLGVADLTLTGIPLAAISGDTEFSVSSQPSANTLPSGSTVTFIVQFAPITSGTYTATISIANNDSDENPYTFTVTGTGQSPTPTPTPTCTPTPTATPTPTPTSTPTPTPTPEENSYLLWTK